MVVKKVPIQHTKSVKKAFPSNGRILSHSSAKPAKSRVIECIVHHKSSHFTSTTASQESVQSKNNSYFYNQEKCEAEKAARVLQKYRPK